MRDYPTSDDREDWAKYFHAELADIKSEFGSLAEKVKADMKEYWLQVIGPTNLNPILKSREAAEEMLGESDARFRDVALRVLAYHWRPDVRLAVRFQELAFSDPDECVRSTAIHCLALCNQHSPDPVIGESLARIVRDESQSIKVRLAAYQGLFDVRGVPPHLRPISPAKLLQGEVFHFPEDVDWAFVDSFLVVC
jgi:hypothetical protein